MSKIFYNAECPDCKWAGSSKFIPSDDSGYDTDADPSCPACGSFEICESDRSVHDLDAVQKIIDIKDEHLRLIEDRCYKRINKECDEKRALKAKLSEHENGIPIEKADKEKNYYYETGGAWFQAKYIDGSWTAWDLYKNSNQPITANWLYRFPAQFSQTQEGG